MAFSHPLDAPPDPKTAPASLVPFGPLTDSRGACAHADGPPAAHRALRPRLPPLPEREAAHKPTPPPQTDYRFSLVFSLVGDMHRLRFPPHFSSAILNQGSMLFTPSSQTSARWRRIRNMLAPGGCGPAFVLWPSPHANARTPTRAASHQTKNGAKLAPLSQGELLNLNVFVVLERNSRVVGTRALSDAAYQSWHWVGCHHSAFVLGCYSKLVSLDNYSRRRPSPGMR